MHFQTYLDKNEIQYKVEGDNLTVGGSLYLRGTQITALPDNLTVGGSLDLRDTQITALPDNLTVGGSLDLWGTQITALPDNLTVGGYLDLRGTQITALPDNLTVGGSLYLRDTQITALPDNLTVGGSLYLRGTQITAKEVKKPADDFLNYALQRKGQIVIDDIYAALVNRKGNILKVRNFGSRAITFAVTDGNGNWSHGKTLQKAMADLTFKTADRDVTQYQNMPKDTVKTVHEWSIAYHVATGSCRHGIENFINQQSNLKEAYTLQEILDLTAQAYRGSVFKEIVCRQKVA